MVDYKSICSAGAVESAVKDGDLVKIFLLPAELGGRDVVENVTFVPPNIAAVKEKSTVELIAAVRSGLTAVEITPTYRGASFVPTSIIITASGPNSEHEFKLVVGVW